MTGWRLLIATPAIVVQALARLLASTVFAILFRLIVGGLQQIAAPAPAIVVQCSIKRQQDEMDRFEGA